MFNRAIQNKQRSSSVHSVPGPTDGWVQNANLRKPGPTAAEVLDNMVPTERGAQLRGGSASIVVTPDGVKALMPYEADGARTLLVATGSSIYTYDSPEPFSTTGDVPHADGEMFSDGEGYDSSTGSAIVTGFSSGDWSYVQFANSAGEYIAMVNGVDGLHTYDGASVAAQTTTGATGLDAIWSYGKRLFFTQTTGLSAWYLATNAIAGALTEFPLQGVFSRGGRLMFGATWSLDSGAGLDDKCIFVTDQGQIAVYSGTDPSSNFAIEGVYDIAKPLSKNGWFKTGGDIAIMTEEGIVSLSAAISRDRAALTLAAITYPIESAWREAVAQRTSSRPFTVTFWRSEGILIVSGIQDAGTPICFVANSQNGAWCRFTGWDVQAGCVLGDDFFFGTADGDVRQAYYGGTDNGSAITATYVARFDNIDGVTQKEAMHARLVARANTGISPRTFANSDYIVTLPDSVDASAGTTSDAWGSGKWGEFIWGGRQPTIAVQQWQTVRAIGSALSVGVQVKSTNTERWVFEVVGMDLVYRSGRLIP